MVWLSWILWLHEIPAFADRSLMDEGKISGFDEDPHEQDAEQMAARSAHKELTNCTILHGRLHRACEDRRRERAVHHRLHGWLGSRRWIIHSLTRSCCSSISKFHIRTFLKSQRRESFWILKARTLDGWLCVLTLRSSAKYTKRGQIENGCRDLQDTHVSK